IIPAYNEELFLPKTFSAIRRAEAALGESVEVIVADNMSSDQTVDVARDLGARVVQEETRCIGVVRNRAVLDASSENLIFLDADDSMSENMLVEIKKAMESGKYIGGGVARTIYERNSPGIYVTHGLLRFRLWIAGISLFLMYTTREAFDAIGGYNVTMKAGEDFELGAKLRALGKTRGQKFMNLKTAWLAKSARKFDEYGDWATFKNPRFTFRAMRNEPDAIHEIWYKERRVPGTNNDANAPNSGET
ncbi:MAG: glycosyltransferase, partial [Candidatus Hydrogenedentes bacterium]|nr:glycosyltransferase [Candidatus Hydrogenedentota bacterium]